jgi:hypothetical protein
MKNAKDILTELYGDKEIYDKYEALTAMSEYAIYKLDEQHKSMMQFIKEAFATPLNVSQ